MNEEENVWAILILAWLCDTDVDIDYIRYDYIMWSLSNQNRNKFIRLIIEKRKKIINELIDKIEKQRCNIEFLNKELVEDD